MYVDRTQWIQGPVPFRPPMGSSLKRMDLLYTNPFGNYRSVAYIQAVEKVSDENDSRMSLNVKIDGEDGPSDSSKHTDTKREKSLWLIAQNFVKLLFCSEAELITLDSAAVALLGDVQNSSAMKRLYDIANVFSSMNLIEKNDTTTHHPDSWKPAFRWLGWGAKLQNGSTTALVLNESKKTMFGTEITNHCLKRTKANSSVNRKLNQKENTKAFPLPSAVTPFTFSNPISGSCWISPIPQFTFLTLSDLFAHYMEAWKFWYAEVAGKEEIHLSP
ncbi:hypothetical protein REPUB_Repub10bG0036200 [Reevesia pubescens]